MAYFDSLRLNPITLISNLKIIFYLPQVQIIRQFIMQHTLPFQYMYDITFQQLCIKINNNRIILMDKSSLKLLNTCVILSIFALVLDMTLLIIRIIFQVTGFEEQNFPSCSVSSYLQLKIKQTSLIFKASTILIGLTFIFSIIVLILLIQKWRSIRINKEQSHQTLIFNLVEITFKIYPLASFQILFLLINGGSAISLLTYNNSCSIIMSNICITILIVANSALIITVALLILIIILNRLQNSKPNNSNHLKMTDIQRQEQEIQKKFEEQAQDYFSTNNNHQNQIMKGLIHHAQEIYEADDNDKKSDKTRREFTKQKQKKKGSNQSENEQILIGSKGNEPSQKQKKNQINAENQPVQKRSKYSASLMHQYYQNKIQPNNQQEIEYNYKPNYFNHQFYNNRKEQEQLERQIKLEEMNRLKNTLIVDDIDNVSQKFEEQNFQLVEDLSLINEKENHEPLSFLQTNEMKRFTEGQFKLKSKNKNSLILQKEYTILGDQNTLQQYKINITFVKIRNYKANLKINQERETEDEMNSHFNDQYMEDNGNIKNILSTVEQPLSQEIIKLSKIILFKNYPCSRQQQRNEQECPILKYIEKDEGLQILPNNNFRFNGQKAIYENEQLVFSKKKDNSNRNQNNNSVREKYNENEEVYKERKQFFGKEWLKQKYQQQEYSHNAVKSKSKRLHSLNCIRSKYHQ